MASLSLKNVCKVYPNGFEAVKDFNLDVADKEFIIFVGPSGCGKSTTLRMIAGLEEISSGDLIIDGKVMNDVEPKDRDIAMVFQNYALYPHMTVFDNMAFGLKLRKVPKDEIKAKVEEAARILDLEKLLDRKPKALSGGQRQRVLIAMALTRDPKLVICDEPTTALDVTVQKQVIKLLNDLQAKLGFAMIFVSHDLALVAEVAHNITVMYAGQVIEQAPTKELLTNPIHEYTRGLLGSVLSIESGSGRLHQVPGAVPSPRDFPKGDRFAPRSSHPRIGLDTRPVFKRVPGTEHFYSELPDEVLKANGLTPHAEVM